MPCIETSSLKQTAVYWAADDYDDHGEPTVSATAVEIDVRWEPVDREATSAQQGTVAIDAVAYVDRDVAVGSRLWLGKLDDLPSPVTDAMQVVRFTKTPDIKGRHYTRRIDLMRIRNSL